MNAETYPERTGLLTEQTIQSMKDSQGARWMRNTPLMRHFQHAPLADAFCTALGPVLYWLGVPSNSAIALVIMFAAPIIVLFLLPVFIVLIPLLILLTSLGVASSSSVGATHVSATVGNPRSSLKQSDEPPVPLK